ncbi:hypothetical protein ACR56S_03750 [Staphylococcus hominis]|uniref:hypothetical protein n=1 Tax=Staphylococcus hominis TaxID=1290 RepID=UPI003DA04853
MDNEKEIKEIALAVNVVQENGDEIAKNDMYDMLELREKFLEEVRSRHLSENLANHSDLFKVELMMNPHAIAEEIYEELDLMDVEDKVAFITNDETKFLQLVADNIGRVKVELTDDENALKEAVSEDDDETQDFINQIDMEQVVERVYSGIKEDEDTLLVMDKMETKKELLSEYGVDDSLINTLSEDDSLFDITLVKPTNLDSAYEEIALFIEDNGVRNEDEYQEYIINEYREEDAFTKTVSTSPISDAFTFVVELNENELEDALNEM